MAEEKSSVKGMSRLLSCVTKRWDSMSDRLTHFGMAKSSLDRVRCWSASGNRQLARSGNASDVAQRQGHLLLSCIVNPLHGFLYPPTGAVPLFPGPQAIKIRLPLVGGWSLWTDQSLSATGEDEFAILPTGLRYR